MNMKKLVLGLVLAIVAITMIASTSCGGDPCEELADICPRCTSESQKSACQSIANADEHDSCDSAVSTYGDACP